MNTTEMLDKAKSGLITRQEVAAVARALAGGGQGHDLYTLIHILGASGATEHEALVAGFLDSPDDPMLARIALQTLISRWGLAPRYRDRVEAFARGVDWDVDADVRHVAISAAGELLRAGLDKSLLGLLLEIFTSPSEQALVRQSAYLAMARAAGKEWNEMPPASRKMDLERDVDPGVLSWASERVQ